VSGLGIDCSRVERAADLAFTLRHDAPLTADIERTLEALGERPLVVVMPSAVVESWCQRHDIDHTALMAKIVGRACDDLKVAVALVPHAYRKSGRPRRMDDARVCRAIAETLGQRSDVTVIDLDISPPQIRAIVSRAELLVASRFHGMVTGLGSATPTVVVGWGHKYAEVLAQFDAERFALDYSALQTPDVVSDAIEKMWRARSEINGQLQLALEAVQVSAMHNFATLDAVAGRRS
jgi:colanic acid/amylovoran biosynthesis protein